MRGFVRGFVSGGQGAVVRGFVRRFFSGVEGAVLESVGARTWQITW